MENENEKLITTITTSFFSDHDYRTNTEMDASPHGKETNLYLYEIKIAFRVEDTITLCSSGSNHIYIYIFEINIKEIKEKHAPLFNNNAILIDFQSGSHLKLKI